MFRIIHNPYANRGGSLLYLQAFLELLDAEGLQYTIHPTTAPGHATTITREIIAGEGGTKKIISLGGDGTLHEVINGYTLGDDVVFGILPAGTGNDVATMLGLPAGAQNVRQAARPILANMVKPIDYMLESSGSDKQSVLFFSFGVAANMVMLMDSFPKKTKASYYKSIFLSAFKLQAKTYEYSIDDGPVQTVTADFMALHNCIHGGGGMVLARDAVIDDGYAEVFIVEHRGMARRMRNLTALTSKKIHKQPNVKIIKAKKISIYSKDNDICCVDGEILRVNQLDLTVVTGGLKIFRE